jgi:plasmid stabilization system protein ParE
VVIWTLSARADLKAIHDYIAKDAPQNANTVAREILRKADTLAELPRLGKTIPELNEDSLREISAYVWRILYHLRQSRIFISLPLCTSENNSTQMKSANEYQANKQA